MVTDMTEGKTWKVLLNFSLPMLLSVAFQQIYNIADSVIAGNFVNDKAMSAIGASYPVTMIFMAIATGGSVGVSVVAARHFGAKHYTRMKTVINTALVSFLALSAVLTVIGCIICTPILQLLGTPADIFSDSDIYLRVYVFGLTFLMLYNVCNGIFTALGDSRTPLIFLIISSLGNIGLDLLFVLSFGMGVDGVAWATFTAQGIASVLSAVTLLKRIKKLECEHKPDLFSLPALSQICRVSLPSILQSSFVSVGNLFIQGLVNSFGSAVIGGYSAAIKLNTFCLTCLTTLSGSVSNFTAQNMGANKPDRIKKGLRSGIIMSVIVTIPFTILYLTIGGLLVNLFATEADPMIIKTGKTFLYIVSPFYAFITIKIIIDGVLRGCAVMKPFVFSTCLDLVLRVALAFVLSPVFGSNGIWMSWPIGWMLATLINIIFYRRYIVRGKAFQ